ncbi:PQ-loop domain-containing transporter [Chitinibacter sp. FCG-7]|uniref:PQ-loop domain-containing transporter n=1 Tax=Chitinibacter mangrovi TaxID=3153927 RepID=A0AAU7FFE2_9NEIS
MPEPWLLKTANLLQICVPLLSLSAYLPQWKKILRTRSAHDISLRAWLIWTVSSLFALCYAAVQWLINQQTWPLLISSSATVLCVLTTVALVLFYRRRAGE